MIKDEAIKNLQDIKDILNDLDITFWLDGGTLLGAYRDQDFCEGDEDDIDICTWENYLYQKDEIIKKAKNIGFELKHKWELEIALTRNGSKIDLFFNRKNKHDAYTHLYSGDTICKYVVIPAKYYECLGDIEFYEMMFKIPLPTEDYLALKYGDWKTKIHRKDYLCINKDQNKLVRDTYEI